MIVFYLITGLMHLVGHIKTGVIINHGGEKRGLEVVQQGTGIVLQEAQLTGLITAQVGQTVGSLEKCSMEQFGHILVGVVGITL